MMFLLIAFSDSPHQRGRAVGSLEALSDAQSSQKRSIATLRLTQQGYDNYMDMI